jgi:predicted phage-related endonuclease
MNAISEIPTPPYIRYFPEIEQGSDEWLQLRAGILTASSMKLIVTPTLKTANNDKTRAHLWELLAQRVTGYVEPQFVSDDMLRGHTDEVYARIAYSENYAEVHDMGFITSDRFGFTIGFSPDGLVGDDGFIECKSRRQRFQMETIVENTMPSEYMMQIQTGFLVSERKWCDFISYSGGMHMVTLRILPDREIMDAIVAAATDFETKLNEKLAAYRAALASNARLIPTERIVEQEMFV